MLTSVLTYTLVLVFFLTILNLTLTCSYTSKAVEFKLPIPSIQFRSNTRTLATATDVTNIESIVHTMSTLLQQGLKLCERTAVIKIDASW